MTGDPDWLKPIIRDGETLRQRVLAQAAVAGITPPKYVLDGMPKEWLKTLYFGKVREALLAVDPSEVMTKQKSAAEYIEQVVAPRSGWKARKGRKGKGRAPDYLKQFGMFGVTRAPAFTPLASQHSLEQIIENVRRSESAVSSSTEWGNDPMKAEVTGPLDSFGIHGLNSPLFVCGHANCVAGVDVMPWTPLDQSGRPQELYMPMRYYEESQPKVRGRILPPGTYLKPSHLLVGSPSAGGKYGDGHGVVNVNNAAGAAGAPYILMENAREATSNGRRASKANTTKREIQKLIDHVRAGQPWSGPTMKALMQPATLTTRGDAKSDLDLVIFTTAMLQAGYPLAHLLLSGRGIVITSTISWLMESIVGGPWTEALDAFDVKAYDLRGRRLVKEHVRELFASHAQGKHESVSGDVSRWDLNAAPGEHGLMAAHWANLLPPGEHPLLFGAASLPALWRAEQIDRLMATIPVGDSMKVSVEVVDPETAKSHVEEVEVHHLMVDLRKMVVQAFQAVHGAGVTLAGYDIPAQTYKVPVPTSILEFGDTRPAGEEWFIHAHGCIRSGSLLTSANNSTLNDYEVEAGYRALARLGAKSTFVQRRAKLAGVPPPTRITAPPEGVDGFFRGDDSLIEFTRDFQIMSAEGPYDLGQKFALLMAMSGRYGNYAKQLFGTRAQPLYEFASVVYSQDRPGGITPSKRSQERSITTEGTTSAGERLPMTEEEAENLATSGGVLDLGKVTDQLSAKMRLLPQAGSDVPLSAFGNPTPGHEELLRNIAFMDRHGLVYDLAGLTPEEYKLVLEAEAVRYASREARKSGATKLTQQQLRDEYMEADLNRQLVEFAKIRGEKQMPGRRPQAALRDFETRVSQTRKGNSGYLF